MVPISVLGVVTIIGYGACYYAYGVLIGPIGADTGWPDAALGAIFSATLVITGVGGMVAGRVLDRRGPRPVFLVAGIAGAGAMLLASAQGALLPFAIAYAGGCGLVGALGFYHITQAVAARTAPAAPAQAIILLTLFGAFSSPLYLPLTAWLTGSAGWRGARTAPRGGSERAEWAVRGRTRPSRRGGGRAGRCGAARSGRAGCRP